jgi:5,10-methylenetetrahydrofolate reductase
MRIDEMARQPQRGFSFAFFPPKADEGFRSPDRTIEKLESRSPDFMPATWGAGGSTRRSFGSPMNR